MERITIENGRITEIRPLEKEEASDLISKLENGFRSMFSAVKR